MSYNSDRSDCVCITAQSKSSYMKILTVQDQKIIFKIKISFDLDMEIQGLHMPNVYSGLTWTQTKFP